MHVFYRPKRRVPKKGARELETTRLHIGWSYEDPKMWDKWPFLDANGKLAYSGAPVITIHEDPDNIRITIIKAHAGKRFTRVGEVRVIDDTHTTEVIVDTSILDR